MSIAIDSMKCRGCRKCTTVCPGSLIELDENKDYIVLFTPKNRFGETQPQLVYERNMSFNTLKEIGYVEIQYDGFKR